MRHLKIAQLGEGLSDVRIVTLYKKEGEEVDKDEVLLEVETDKAVMEIESPYTGRLVKWLAVPGEIVPVGETVALIEEAPGAKSLPPQSASLHPKTVRNAKMSPRERAAREKNEPNNLDGDAFPTHNRLILSGRQERLRELFSKSQNYVAQASLSVQVPWDVIPATCRRLKHLDGLDYRPVPYELIAWCAVHAMKKHPGIVVNNFMEKGYFKSSEISIGNAVALPGDELAIAPLNDASTHGIESFISEMRKSIESVRNGRTIPGHPQLFVSYMAQHEVWYATPRILPPCVATLFIGTPYEVPGKSRDGGIEWQRVSNFVLAFDHNILNGAGAAAFLRDVKNAIGELPQLL